MGRPGIMLYFDMLEPLGMLSDGDRGRLLMAMLAYGQDGSKPDFEGTLRIVWSFVQHKLDRDAENYDASKIQRQYAAFCKKRKGIWMPRISFEEWILMTDEERKRAVDPVEARNPSTSTSTATTTTAAAAGNRQPSSDNHHLSAAADSHQPTEEETAAAAYRELKYFQGELGKGVVMLSEEQVEKLLDTMGLDAFDHYVSKLANFIIKNGASVKSHYETILKWWRVDRSA